MSHPRKEPLVSICIPIYNGANYLEDCLISAYQQDYERLEIIVSDDASTDNSLEIVQRIQAKYDVPTYIYHHTPSGIGANWNNCIKFANGDYIKLLFQDDILDPLCVNRMMESILENTNIGLVYCTRSFIVESRSEQFDDFITNYGQLHTHWDNIIVKEGTLSGKRYLKDKNFLNSPKNKIGEPTCVLINKECFNTIGYFNEDMKQVLDCDFWYRIMSFYDIGFIDIPLVKFRLHNRQTSVINKTNKNREEELLYKSYYKNLFKFLHPFSKKKLLKNYHPFFKTIYNLKITLLNKSRVR